MSTEVIFAIVAFIIRMIAYCDIMAFSGIHAENLFIKVEILSW